MIFFFFLICAWGGTSSLLHLLDLNPSISHDKTRHLTTGYPNYRAISVIKGACIVQIIVTESVSMGSYCVVAYAKKQVKCEIWNLIFKSQAISSPPVFAEERKRRLRAYDADDPACPAVACCPTSDSRLRKTTSEETHEGGTNEA